MIRRITFFTLRILGSALAFITMPLWGPIFLALLAAIKASREISEWVQRVWRESAKD